MAEYISKEAVLQKFLERGSGYIDMLTIKTMVDEIPSADVQPVKRGKWIGVDYDTYFECSECKHMTDWQLYKYCPYCGARMIKDGDTEYDKI